MLALFIQDVTKDHLLFEPLLVNYKEASLYIGILLVFSPDSLLLLVRVSD